MGAVRNIIAGAFIAVFLYYLSAGHLTDNDKWVLISILGALAFFWVILGNQSKPIQAPRPQQRTIQSVARLEENDDEEEEDIPAPITNSTETGQTLRERKMAKIAAIESRESKEDEDNEVIVEVEEVHVAEEFVVEVSPETFEEADIQVSVTERKERHDKIRERIEVRRRNQLADIRTAATQKWHDADVREDIIALLKEPNHGLTIHYEPEQLEPGHTYGSTFVRLDEHNILRIRVPLDVGFEAVTEKKGQEGLQAPLISPDGKILPPLIGPDGKPLPLPPLPSASGQLAALRESINKE
jgi:hypothetical protein